MLAFIRRFAKTWPARALFAVLVIAFGLWGVAGRLYNQSADTAAARVGDRRVEAAELQRVYTRQIADLTRRNPPGYQPSAEERARQAHEALRQLIGAALIADEMARLGLVVPDAAIRDETFSLPAFKGINGQFDRQTFLNVLARNGMNEASFIALARDDLGSRQLTGAIQAGFATPEPMMDAIFAYARQTRDATAVSLPIAAAGEPAAPTEAQLRRFWVNHPQLYATPEYRRAKVIVLSAQTLGREMTVTDDEIKRFYTLSKSDYDRPEKRSLQILSAPDQPTAARLATAWQGGTSWTAMQAMATAAGATALDLPNAAKPEVPDPALAAAAFAAAQGSVSAPIKGEGGWFVMQVTAITPAIKQSLDQARDDIRQKIGVLKANDAMDDHVNKLEDALAGGGGLDSLPQGLGVAAVAGTLDAQGNTPQGAPAPLPGYPALRSAIVAAAFKTKPGDPPQVEQVAPDQDNVAGGYYAVQVESITPPSQLGYDVVAARVRGDWTHDQMRRAQEAAAAALLTQVQAGHALPAAARAVGLTAIALPPVPRPAKDLPPPTGVPAALVDPLFAMKPGEATMVQTPDGFMVAALTSIDAPKPTSDPIGAGQLSAELTQSLGADASELFAAALARHFGVTVNQRLVDQVARP